GIGTQREKGLGAPAGGADEVSFHDVPDYALIPILGPTVSPDQLRVETREPPTFDRCALCFLRSTLRRKLSAHDLEPASPHSLVPHSRADVASRHARFHLSRTPFPGRGPAFPLWSRC